MLQFNDFDPLDALYSEQPEFYGVDVYLVPDGETANNVVVPETDFILTHAKTEEILSLVPDQFQEGA